MRKWTAVLLGLVLLCISAASFAEADTWICASCGRESFGNFCAWCGAKKAEDKAVCPACGTEYDPSAGYAFCTSCGASLISSGTNDDWVDWTPAPTVSYEPFVPFATIAPATPTPSPVWTDWGSTPEVSSDTNGDWVDWTPAPTVSYEPFEPFATIAPATSTPSPDAAEWWFWPEPTPVVVALPDPNPESPSLEGTWRLVHNPKLYYGMEFDTLLDGGGTILLAFANGQMSMSAMDGPEVHEVFSFPYTADNRNITVNNAEQPYSFIGNDLLLEGFDGENSWLFEKLDSSGEPAFAQVSEEFIRGTWKLTGLLFPDGEGSPDIDELNAALQSGKAMMVFTFADGKWTIHEENGDFRDDRDGEYRIQNGRLWIDNAPVSVVITSDNAISIFEPGNITLMVQRQ